MSLPRIIPVIDVLGGVVVRAVGGRRDEYRPLTSRITSSTVPWEVARDLQTWTGRKEIYVADLDAILGQGTIAPAVLELIETADGRVWLDTGIRTPSDFPRYPWPRVRPIVGFESAESAECLSSQCAFSLDLWNGELFGPWARWGVRSSRDWMGVIDRAIGRGVRTLIVLDLPAVGSQGGPGTQPICQAIRQRYPEVELLTGGGVRNADDLARLGEVGVDGVLIASAIHDGIHFTTDTSA